MARPKSNLVKDQNGDLLAGSHVLNRWKNYFSLLLTVHRVSDVKQIAESLVPDPSPFEAEITIAKLKRYKSQGNDQIPAELLQAGGEILRWAGHVVRMIGWGGMDWIDLAQDRDQRRDLVNTVVNLRVP
ncbi:hypothetical protein B7P43_G14137 [Cryptotermes secundus]|uniref:Uncharacterized protein n=1 Tax=Cryptotermes secundus TaxID=105785 RepID=A0A2J7Q2R5_9NEOP|nr:hypothetical protein B7P43_G14137 [Cryptotermes secundus]